MTWYREGKEIGGALDDAFESDYGFEWRDDE